MALVIGCLVSFASLAVLSSRHIFCANSFHGFPKCYKLKGVEYLNL